MRIQPVLGELSRLGITHAPTITAVEAKIILRDWQNEHIQALIITLAENCGHRVIFTPLHYSDLQPIELVWAKIKRNIAAQYNKDNTQCDMRNRLCNEFEELSSEEGRESILRIIDLVKDVMKKFLEEISKEEENENFLENRR